MPNARRPTAVLAAPIVVDVIDDQFGVIAEALRLEPGETVTLSYTAVVTETTTNTATGVGQSVDGPVCGPATDSTEVLVSLPFGVGGESFSGWPAVEELTAGRLGGREQGPRGTLLSTGPHGPPTATRTSAPRGAFCVGAGGAHRGHAGGDACRQDAGAGHTRPTARARSTASVALCAPSLR